jgi:SAM-dependent methyltransferase
VGDSTVDTGQPSANEQALWRGVDFSGLTVVLGVGTGRLVALLNEQAAAASGNLVVVHYNPEELRTLLPLVSGGSLSLLRGRARQMPIRGDTVDLLVVNAVLREVPEGRLEVMFEELWRVLVPGGQLRISDIIEASEADAHQAWAERNRIVRKLGKALGKPTAIAVNLQRAAMAARSAGFEELGLSFLPGYALTAAWLEETVNGIRNTAGRIVDRDLRAEILDQDTRRLIGAYARGGQRAAERFVLQGQKAGDQALSMRASFTEEDLPGLED